MGELVSTARIPILKLRFDGLDCDVSWNNLLPLHNTRLLAAYAGASAACVRLAQYVKRWAKQSSVHGARYGHLSSYAFTLMCIYYLQIQHGLPSLQEGAEHAPLWVSGKLFNVGFNSVMTSDRLEALESKTDACIVNGFFQFFADDFLWGLEVASIRNGRRLNRDAFPRLQHRLSVSDSVEMLFIEDPIEVHRDLSCVLWPGHSHKLRTAVTAQARKDSAVTTGSFCGGVQEKVTVPSGQSSRQSFYVAADRSHRSDQSLCIQTFYPKVALTLPVAV